MTKIAKNLENKIQKVAEDRQPLNFRGGDTVWLEYRDYVDSKRYKTFTGLCLSKAKKGSGEVLVVRTSVGGIGVEYGFHSLSKNIKDLKLVRAYTRRGGRVKRPDLRLKNMR